MIVMKFGGTSVEDAGAMRRVIGIVRKERKRQPLIVVSACAGVTNDILRLAHTVLNGKPGEAQTLLTSLRRRHNAIASDLLDRRSLVGVRRTIDGMFRQLRDYVEGVRLLGELTDRSLDAFAGFGERLSSLILSAGMNRSGIPAELVDARTLMVTDRSYGSAEPQLTTVAGRARSSILPILARGSIPVTQGFIGAAADGTPTTIGRGGSDYSAAIFGAALKAKEIQIWTDVDGMMTADPRLVPGARPITELTFDEASELAYFGAKVLHPRTILPAVKRNIPVRILNSLNPGAPGTLIVGKASGRARKERTSAIVGSIAFKKGITVVNVNSSRMLMAHGFLEKLFSIFAQHQRSVDVVSTSEVSVSLTLDSTEGLGGIVSELRKIGETRVQQNKAIICIVGEGMKHTPGIAARIFGALARARVNIEMVSEGASEINLTLVVDERAVAIAVKVLHDEFFPPPAG